MIHWVPIKEILGWKSVDYGEYQQISQVLRNIEAEQAYYKAALTFLAAEGFTEPLMCLTRHGQKYQADGHHRLAAAITLGYKYIPYFMSLNEWFVGEFTNWTPKQLIHPDNPLPAGIPSKQFSYN